MPTERKISIPYSEADSGAGSDCSEDHEEEDNERKLIKPDIMAISQVLNFDEVRTMGCWQSFLSNLFSRRRKMT